MSTTELPAGSRAGSFLKEVVQFGCAMAAGFSAARADPVYMAPAVVLFAIVALVVVPVKRVLAPRLSALLNKAGQPAGPGWVIYLLPLGILFLLSTSGVIWIPARLLQTLLESLSMAGYEFGIPGVYPSTKTFTGAMVGMSTGPLFGLAQLAIAAGIILMFYRIELFAAGLAVMVMRVLAG